MKIKFLIALLISCISIPTVGYSVELIKSATIIEIVNTGSNQEKFAVTTSGGSGICATGNRILTFPVDAATSQEIYKRAFSMVLTAFSTGSKVTINNYESNAAEPCKRAAYIKLTK